MTTVKPSRASRSATAEPIPREAPVTIAILAVRCSISSLLIIFRGQSASDEQQMCLSSLRIIGHLLTSQSEICEQMGGPIRRDARVHTRGGATQLHASGRGSWPAALNGDGRREAARSAARRATPATDDASRQSDPRRRGLLAAL